MHLKTNLDLYLYALGQIVLIILFCWSTCRIILWIVYRIWKHDLWIDAEKPPSDDRYVLLYSRYLLTEWVDIASYKDGSFWIRDPRHGAIQAFDAVKWRELPYPKERKK